MAQCKLDIAQWGIVARDARRNRYQDGGVVPLVHRADDFSDLHKRSHIQFQQIDMAGIAYFFQFLAPRKSKFVRTNRIVFTKC